MDWEATDQFGNLYVGVSASRSVMSLAEDFESMAGLVFARKSDGARFSIDLDYQEISAPDQNQVSHVMNLPWIQERLDSGEDRAKVYDDIETALQKALGKFPDVIASIQGPWDG